MKKKYSYMLNDRGFMLVEVVIVTVVVATIMTSLYVAFNRVYKAYESKTRYTNIDGIYALRLMEDYLVNDMQMNTKINNTSTYTEITCVTGNNYDYCDNIRVKYGVNKIYLAKNTEYKRIKNISGINQTFKDYIDYLGNSVDFTDTDYGYLLIGEFVGTTNSSDKIYNYAYLKIKTSF